LVYQRSFFISKTNVLIQPLRSDEAVMTFHK